MTTTSTVPNDPQPSIDRIDDLARRILKGDILLPKFQRNFVWRKDQVLNLLDSVGRGYPIGSILLWQSRQELRSENHIAGLDVELPRPDYPVNYLLDGQQRLSTICGALFWNGTDPRSHWNIAYDLRKGDFLHLDGIGDLPHHLIRARKLADPAGYFQHLAFIEKSDIADRDSLVDNARRLFNRFKDYKIAVVTLGDMSIESVAPVFERINSQGTPLTIVDLMRAATWAPDFDLVDSIQDILAELQDKEYAGIDNKAVLRNIAAATGGSFSSSGIDDLRKRDRDALSLAVTQTGRSYKLAVDFLTTELKVPNAGVLPYVNQMVVLSEFFRMRPRPSREQREALCRWFWRTTVTEHFRGWSSSDMATDQRAIVEFVEGSASELGPDIVTRPTLDLWLGRPFRSNTAASKLLAILLGTLNPLDIVTGQRIDVGTALAWQNLKECHHFFPRSFIINQQPEHREKSNVLANIILLTSASNKHIADRAPSEYLAEAERAGHGLRAVLDSNMISLEAYEAARCDDYPAFLRERATTIAKRVDELCGWHDGPF